MTPEAGQPAAPDFAALLARLLSDAALRREFAANRHAVLRKLSASAELSAVFMRLDIAELEAQARTLLDKRLHEVCALLPRSRTLLPDFDARFLAFAETSWPVGHRRHLQDARDFVELLRRGGLPHSHQEAARLSFLLKQVKLDIQPIPDLLTARGTRRGLLIMWRDRANLLREMGIYLGA